MSNDTDNTVLEHLFNVGFIVETDANGGSARIGDIDFTEAYQNTIVQGTGEFVDETPAATLAAEFLDGTYAKMIEACKAIAAGKDVIVLPAKPIETDSQGDEGEGVLVWFAQTEDDDDFDCAAASEFRKAVDKVVYS